MGVSTIGNLYRYTLHFCVVKFMFYFFNTLVKYMKEYMYMYMCVCITCIYMYIYFFSVKHVVIIYIFYLEQSNVAFFIIIIKK